MEQAKKEFIFICYEDVIKTIKPYILMKLTDPEYKKYYEDYIDYSKYENMSYEDLLKFCSSTLNYNILYSLKKQEFDVDGTFNELCQRFDDIYEKSPTLTMGKNLFILLRQNFVEKIYIYSKEYDERIRNDVSNVYQNTEKMEYLSGDFKECINSIPEKITSFILNDITLINDLIELNKITNSQVLLLDAGYNFTHTENEGFIFKIPNLDQLSKTKRFRTAWFKQYQISNQ